MPIIPPRNPLRLCSRRKGALCNTSFPAWWCLSTVPSALFGCWILYGLSHLQYHDGTDRLPRVVKATRSITMTLFPCTAGLSKRSPRIRKLPVTRCGTNVGNDSKRRSRRPNGKMPAARQPIRCFCVRCPIIVEKKQEIPEAANGDTGRPVITLQAPSQPVSKLRAIVTPKQAIQGGACIYSKDQRLRR